MTLLEPGRLVVTFHPLKYVPLEFGLLFSSTALLNLCALLETRQKVDGIHLHHLLHNVQLPVIITKFVSLQFGKLFAFATV